MCCPQVRLPLSTFWHVSPKFSHFNLLTIELLLEWTDGKILRLHLTRNSRNHYLNSPKVGSVLFHLFSFLVQLFYFNCLCFKELDANMKCNCWRYWGKTLNGSEESWKFSSRIDGHLGRNNYLRMTSWRSVVDRSYMSTILHPVSRCRRQITIIALSLHPSSNRATEDHCKEFSWDKFYTLKN